MKGLLRTMRKKIKQKLSRTAAALTAALMAATALLSVPVTAQTGVTIYDYDGYTVEYIIHNEWDGYQSVEVKITNTGTKPVLNWSVGYDAGGEVTGLWNGEVYSQNGTDYIIKNAGYNYEIAPDAGVNFGYTLAGDSLGMPVYFEMVTKKAEQASGFNAELIVGSDWDTGFTGEIAVTNTSSRPIEAWELTFNTNFTVKDLWNGVITDSSGNSYTVSSRMQNSLITPGNTVSIGINGEKEAGVVPVIDNITMSVAKAGGEAPGTGDEPEDPDPEDPEDPEIPDPVTDYETDTDGDSLPDYLETEFGTDISDPDTDNDGLSDLYELLALDTDPLNPDTDENFVPDGNEDKDGDGLSNLEEQSLVTDPGKADTDNDGLPDYDEVNTHNTDPGKSDTDRDGVNDDEELSKGLDPNNPRTFGEPDRDYLLSRQEDSSPTLYAVNKYIDSLDIENLTPDEEETARQFILSYLNSADGREAVLKLMEQPETPSVQAFSSSDAGGGQGSKFNGWLVRNADNVLWIETAGGDIDTMGYGAVVVERVYSSVYGFLVRKRILYVIYGIAKSYPDGSTNLTLKGNSKIHTYSYNHGNGQLTSETRSDYGFGNFWMNSYDIYEYELYGDWRTESNEPYEGAEPFTLSYPVIGTLTVGNRNITVSSDGTAKDQFGNEYPVDGSGNVIVDGVPRRPEYIFSNYKLVPIVDLAGMINEDNEPEDSDEEIAYLLDKISLIDGYLDKIMPPERKENGELITSENKQCEETLNHFEEYIWPLMYLDKYNKYCEMLGVTEIPENKTYIIEQQKYSAYLLWLREAYGPSGRETFWITSDNYINLLYYEVTDIKGTLKKALNQIVLGDYSEDVTILGTAGQIVISIFGLDLYADITSITYDTTHWEFDWGHAGKTGLDIAALLPLVGSLKYADEFKALSKLSEAKATEKLSDSVDSINDMLKSGKSIDEINDSLKLKILDEIDNIKLRPQKLIDELVISGEKYTLEDLVAITKTPDGKLVWLEKGNASAGLQHIEGHLNDFLANGISQKQIPEFITQALSKGKHVGMQNTRPIYEVVFNGKTHRVAVTVGDNGFIVGANPVSLP